MSVNGQLTPTTGGITPAKLGGRWLKVLRFIWVVLTLFYVSMFLYGLVTNHYFTIENPIVWDSDWSADEMRAALADANIEVETFAGVLTGTFFFPFLINLVVGILIFWRRSDTWIGLIASFAIIGMGITSSSGWYYGWENLFTTIIVPSMGIELSLGFKIATFFTSLGQVSALTMLMTFPNGQFTPRWTRWVMLLFLAYYIAEIISPENLQSWGSIFGVVITLAQIGVPAYSQVYRFRNAESMVVRQQIKWLAFSLVAMFVLFAGIIALSISQPETIEPSGPAVRALIVINFLSYTPILLLPVSIGLAILRYRLWDIDIVINRSLVYGLVTVTLGTVFLAAFGGIQAVLREMVGAEQALYPAVLAGALVAGLFSPTRRMLRRFVDQRFYGIELDYTDAARQEEELRKTLDKEEAVSSFGKYKALGLIGRGGMGEVFKARDPESGETVAIKTLYIRGEGDREELVKRFHREAQAIEELKHSNIVKLFEYGEEGETPYMVMEYIEGGTLSELIRANGGLALEAALPLLAGIANALDYAHGQGIVHRDIKPSNVIVERLDGNPPRTVLMDFGIARMVSAMTALTGTGGMVGTLDYISPEQIQGAHQVDGRADVYSLGVMAYQTITGALPFKHRNPGALIMAHLSTPPPDARELVEDLPRVVAKAIQKAMAKEAGDRFGKAGEFVEAMKG